MKAAVISLRSKSSQWIADALKRYFGSVESINLKHLEVAFNTKHVLLYNGKPLKSFDAAYIRGSYRHVHMLTCVSSFLFKQIAYMPIMPESFMISHDKILTHIALQQNNVPMPKTFVVASLKTAKNLLKTINYPIIAKFPKGTQGKGVLVADSYASASSILDALEEVRQPFLLQEFIDNDGMDYRLIVAGNNIIGAMKRKAAPGEFRSNIHAGGTGEAFEPETDMQRIAIRAAKAVRADICAVDLLKTPLGPVVIEVNISPGLQGITKATNEDIADKIANHIYKKTIFTINSKKKEQARNVMLEISKNQKQQKHEIIDHIKLRGERILLPEIVTKYSNFIEDEEVVIKLSKNHIEIEKF